MTRDSSAPRENFGGNIPLAPKAFYTPGSEAELLEILNRHRGQRIRAIGRLHSWSRAVEANEVMIDLRRMNSVVVHAESDPPWAEVGAGCQIKRLLNELQRQGGYTSQSQGLIKEQAIAGAAGTGTHGSGKHSLSHYIDGLRIARFDPVSGMLRIDEIDSGDELRAARCSLGLLGIVTSVRIPIRRAYYVEEHFRRHSQLSEVLAAEADYPLQQFLFLPWRWDYLAQHRREVDQARSLLAPLYRLYWYFGMDVGLHLIVRALARRLPRAATKLFFRRLAPFLTLRGWKVVDRSDRQLSMAHEMFRHIETEIFVTAGKLPAALEHVKLLLRHAAGETVSLPDELQQDLARRDWLSQWGELRGRYVHGYPICIRKVLPDDTLISMASGNEVVYAISMISYVVPSKRDGFFRMAAMLSKTLAHWFGGRPHWGKHCPLERADFDKLYPAMDQFREIVARHDSKGRFGNDWLKGVFGK